MKTKSQKSATQLLASVNPRRHCHQPTVSRQRHRVLELLGSLHRNHLQWAELVIRLREETPLTYRDIAQLAEAPIARVRRACTNARRHRVQLLASTTTN